MCTEISHSQNKQMSKIFQRKAKLRLVRRNVLQDFAAFSQPWISSTRSPPLLQKRKTVFCCSGSWEQAQFFFSKPLILSEELSVHSTSERKTRNTKNQRGLGFLPSVVAETFSPIPPRLPPFLLFSIAQGLLSPCSWKAEVLVFGD